MNRLAWPLLGLTGWGCLQDAPEPVRVRLEACDRSQLDAGLGAELNFGPDAGLDAGGAGLDVAGVYDYESPLWNLSGTITFAQQGNRVSVVETTYNHDARSLVGEADLEGNRLDVTLTPANGDTDYSAGVSLIFAEGGERFCLLQFTDTNDDYGGEGSYRGRLRP
jgi:hypothetical protein